MADNFNDPFAANLIGLWDFLAGAEKKDTGLADGIAQDGDLRGNASISDGKLHLSWDGCVGGVFDVAGDSEVPGNDDPFDLAEGTVAVQFTQDHQVGSSPDTIVNRGEYADRGSEGFFEIRVTKYGRVEVMHCANGEDVILQTDKDFFCPGDTVKATYSWSETDGGSFKVENLTAGTETVIDFTTTGLTMDIGDNDDESWSFGAREKDDGEYDRYFDGSIDYVAIYDADIINGAPGDGIVSGTGGADLIDTAYTGDPQGDMIDAGDAILAGEAPDDDIVDAGADDDTVLAGEGDDDVYAGGGNDSVEGGSGNDLIYGDSDLPGGPGAPTPRESFEWDLAGVSDGHDIGGFTQNTGSVDVTFSILQETGNADTEFSTDDQNVAGIDADGAPVDENSSLDSETKGCGNQADYRLDFSAPVANVSFRINDIDGDGVVRVTALDGDGNPIPVTLTGGDRLTLLDTDGVAGADTADSDGGYLPDTSAEYSLLVDIPGPVSAIIIEHDQDGSNNSGINVTDVYFDVPGDPAAEGPGDDTLLGGIGDDTIFGEAGNDLLAGGEGADEISGGADADTILGGAGDVVDGGAAGVDLDVLDLTGQGPFYLDNVTPDSNGNGINGRVIFVDTHGNPNGLILDFTEIEQVIGEEINRGPDAQDDTASTDEDTALVIDVLGNDSDPDGDPLEVTAASSPDGDVTINPDGTITFTPDENFNGETTISYTVSDGNGGTDTATVTVTVAPVNDAPVAVDDTATTPFETPIVIDAVANDTDVDGDPLTIVSASVPAAQGTVAIVGNQLVFTPADGFEGAATIDYSISDGNGGTDDGQVSVTVQEQPLDGIVEGTSGDDLIDTDYLGDPEGDRIDNEDAILPGEAPNDDIVEAGDGNDTVLAGEGADEVYGGAGDDLIDTGTGNLNPDIDYPGLYPADTDPEDDRDFVDGGTGADTISTGDDRDTIIGGDGNDVIDGGIDDDQITGDEGADRIVGGEGNDNILGGVGNDTIYAGNDPDLGLDFLNIEDDGSGPLGPDLRPNNGRDTVSGGDGDDVIFGADDDDVLSGDAGNDYIDGEIDDDIIDGGIGDDTLLGGQGNDLITGGDGNDSINAGRTQDTVFGGDGDDTILGENGADILNGDAGNDLIDGGTGDDTLNGGAGQDTILGATGDDVIDGGDGNDLIDGGNGGNDSMSGGADRDTFINVNAGETVDGGGAGDDYDVLDLRGSAPGGDGSLSVTFTGPDSNGNGQDGFVTYFDGDGNVVGQLDFTEIEEVIPCFTPGTLIATPTGERPVESLEVSDKIITRDNGIQEIRWVGRKSLTGVELNRNHHLRPVRISKGALGNGLPERDMYVSPNHRVLVANDKTALYFDESEVLVAAKHLTGLPGVDIVNARWVTYIHILFDQHEVILSDGAWTESFQPGDNSLKGVGNAQRNEIFELFPELKTREGIDGYIAARRSLKKHEAVLITR